MEPASSAERVTSARRCFASSPPTCLRTESLKRPSGKKGGLANYRRALSYITKEDVAHKLFNDVAPKYADRNGGYTRVTRLGARRGDAAEMAVIELV